MVMLVKQAIGLILCMLLLVSCTASPSKSTQATPLPNRQATQLSTSDWETLHLPTTPANLLSSAVLPTDPATIYVCTREGSTASITLWRTKDAGKNWSPLFSSELGGSTCAISLASAASNQRVVLLIGEPCNNQASCPIPRLYFSINRGENWRQIPLATILSIKGASRENELLITESHLYLWESYSIGTERDTSQFSLLTRSDDDGHTWKRIDGQLEPYGFFFSPRIDRGGELALATTQLAASRQRETLLWTSRDAGDTWEQTGPIPASNSLLSARQTSNFPLYALANEQLPIGLARLKVLQSRNGRDWSLLPPLPVPGRSAEHPGLQRALTVTNSGTLLASGPEPPETASRSEKQTWLWLWNPRTSIWQVLSKPLPSNEGKSCDACWSAQIAVGPDRAGYLYVWPLEEPNSLYRLRLPDVSGVF